MNHVITAIAVILKQINVKSPTISGFNSVKIDIYTHEYIINTDITGITKNDTISVHFLNLNSVLLNLKIIKSTKILVKVINPIHIYI